MTVSSGNTENIKMSGGIMRDRKIYYNCCQQQKLWGEMNNNTDVKRNSGLIEIINHLMTLHLRTEGGKHWKNLMQLPMRNHG